MKANARVGLQANAGVEGKRAAALREGKRPRLPEAQPGKSAAFAMAVRPRVSSGFLAQAGPLQHDRVLKRGQQEEQRCRCAAVEAVRAVGIRQGAVGAYHVDEETIKETRKLHLLTLIA